jgi:hypothetical protein
MERSECDSGHRIDELSILVGIKRFPLLNKCLTDRILWPRIEKKPSLFQTRF